MITVYQPFSFVLLTKQHGFFIITCKSNRLLLWCNFPKSVKLYHNERPPGTGSSLGSIKPPPVNSSQSKHTVKNIPGLSLKGNVKLWPPVLNIDLQPAFTTQIHPTNKLLTSRKWYSPSQSSTYFKFNFIIKLF